MVSNLNYIPGLGRSDHLVIAFKFKCYNIHESNANTRQRLNFFKGDFEITIKQKLEDKIGINYLRA